jgi:putative ABC transport system ATP-binding protein
MNSKTAIVASDIKKNYVLGGEEINVLKDVSLEVEVGDFVSISGASGSGKTTLLNIIGGIDKPSDGKIRVFDTDLGTADEDSLAEFRSKNVGFVFQAYNLISTLTVSENIAFPMEWTRKPADHIQKRVAELLDAFGLRDRADHFPSQLSGGEQQRVAFARALSNDPPLLLVDEPTGNLDEKTSAKIIQILRGLQTQRKTIIVATHDQQIFELASRRMCLEDGKLVNPDE